MINLKPASLRISYNFIVIGSIAFSFICNSCKKEELPILSTTAVTNITANSATSGGNITSDGGAEVTVKGVCWSTQENPTTSDSKSNDGYGAGQFVSNITGINAGTIYHVRAYATNAVGTSYGADMSFVSLGQAPEAISLPATNISDSGATLNGIVIANHLSSTVMFEYGTATSYGQIQTAMQSPVTGNNMVNVNADISGLTPGTIYHFRIKSDNSLGITYGNDLTFTTVPIMPILTTNPVSNVTTNSAITGGNISSDGGGSIIAKGVCWSTSSGPTIADQRTNDGTGNSNFTSLITGLQPDTKYYVRAYATNNVGTSYGNENSFITSSSSVKQIIADHTIVADFDKIPEIYMAEVKKMMVSFLGESHSYAYRRGLELLEAAYPDYSCNVAAGEAYTDQYLRVNSGSSTGEAEWFTWYAFPIESRPPASNTIKNTIKQYSDAGNPIHVLGFGWCWDMEEGSTVSIEIDPVFGCHWFGRTEGGPDGTLCFGLDLEDYSITGNRVNMDTYLAATEDYIIYCTTQKYLTQIVFTTGPVQHTGERGFQGHLKHEYIRNYVRADTSRILFDYADILCYDDDGKLTTSTWNSYVYPTITAINLGDESIGHIGPAGAIRLAKAQWWMLARIAGWDGN